MAIQKLRPDPLVTLVFLGILFILSPPLSFAAPQPRLFNGEFELGESGQVACEWSHWGVGTPSYRDGLQGITAIPQGQTGMIVQKVPFCEEGATYAAIVNVPTLQSNGTSIFIGIDPSAGTDEAATVWSRVETEGETRVTAVAKGSVCSVIVAITNDGAGAGEAFVDAVFFETLQAGSVMSPEAPAPDPAVAAVARQRINEAFSLINRDQHSKAAAYLDSILRNLADSRPDAAMALVGLEEVAHGKQFEIYTKGIPKEQWQQHQGLDHLRAVAELYPEQTDACALARTKLGQFYLEWWALPMAEEILESAVADFPNTEGSNWAKTHMLNCHLWGGKDTEADALYSQIETDYQEGRLGIEQKGWADFFYMTRRLKKMGAPQKGEAAFALREELWETYKTSFPELAIRAKMENAIRREEKREYSSAITDYRDIWTAHPDKLQWSGGPAMQLAGILYNQGWKPEHKAEALALLNQIADSQDAPDHIKQQARMDIELYQKSNGFRVENMKWPRYDNLLYNGDFDAPPDPSQANLHRYYPRWRVVLPSPNEVVHWSEDVPSGGLGKITPAWTTAKMVQPATLEAQLIHDLNPMEGNVGYRAHVFVAADGIGGGRPDEVTFNLKIRFLNGFGGLISEKTSGRVTPCTEPGRWQVVELTGITPEDCRYTEVEIHAKSARAGQYTAAITHAYLEITEVTTHAQ